MANDTTEAASGDAKPPTSRRKLIIIVSAVVAALLLAGGFYWYRVNSSRDLVKDGWHRVIVATEAADRDLKSDPNSERLKQVREDLEETDATVENLQYEADSRSAFLADTKALNLYKAFLQAYDEYLTEAVTLASDIDNATEEDLNNLKDKANTAKQAGEELKNQLQFVQDSLPTTVFDLPAFAAEVHKQTVAAKSSQQQAADKEASDKKAVEDNLNNFLQAYQNGDATRMKRYMTDDFVKEYSFSNVTNRQYTKVTSYRITAVTKDGAVYLTTSNVTETYTYPNNPSSTYTYTLKHRFVFDTKYNKWLIDNEERQ